MSNKQGYTKRWQFGLQSMCWLMVILPLSFWMLTSRDELVRIFGIALIAISTGGFVGYMRNPTGRGYVKGAYVGCLISLVVVACVVVILAP